MLVLTSIASRQVDDRDRHDCIEHNTKNWDIQMDSPVKAYLDFRSVQGPDKLRTDMVGNEDAAAPSMDVVDLFCDSHFPP
jgi:hypothetical protein